MNFSKYKKVIDSKLKKIDRKKLIIASLIIVIFALGYLGRSLFIAAIVNGRPITRFSLIRELEKQGGSQTLENLIVKNLIFQESQSLGLSATQEEIDNELARLEQLVGEQGMSLDEALSLQNQSKNDLVEQIKIQKTVEKILADKIVVTDEEVKDYFQKNKDLFEKGATLEEVSSEIKNQLAQSKLSSEYQAWISDLKAKASINYFVNF